MNKANCLSPLSNAVLVWNTVNCSATARMAGARHDRRRGFHSPRLLAAACAGTLGSSIAKMRTECPDDASPANR